MSESRLLAWRTKETVSVVSPFPDKASRRGPRWYERIRGAVGLAAVVVVTGIALAILIGAVLVAAAIFIATAFN